MGNHWNMQWRHKNDVNQSNCIQCAIKTLSTWSFLTKIDYLRNEIIIVIFSRRASFWIRWLRWLQVRLCWHWSQRCWLQQCSRHDADDVMMTTQTVWQVSAIWIFIRELRPSWPFECSCSTLILWDSWCRRQKGSEPSPISQTCLQDT